MPVGDRGDSSEDYYDPDTGEWSDEFFEDEEDEEKVVEKESMLSSLKSKLNNLF